jgi:hypothetical protein
MRLPALYSRAFSLRQHFMMGIQPDHMDIHECCARGATNSSWRGEAGDHINIVSSLVRFYFFKTPFLM